MSMNGIVDPSTIIRTKPKITFNDRTACVKQDFFIFRFILIKKNWEINIFSYIFLNYGTQIYLKINVEDYLKCVKSLKI